MPYATEAELRAAAGTARITSRKSDEQVMEEASVSPVDQRFDVFLSHSITDRELVRGAQALLSTHGLSVYVDWLSDGDLERNGEETEAAVRVKSRMRHCDSLVYLHSQNARESRWCPWEVGYFDALKQPAPRIYVLPITADGRSYEGQSYLRLYESLEREDLRRLDPLRQRLVDDLFGLRRS